MKKFLPVGLLVLMAATNVNAQQFGFQRIYNLFQAKCVSCHSNASPGQGLDLEGSGDATQKKQQVFNNLVNVTPANAAAAAKGYKYINPGDPGRSYLFRKVAHTTFEGGYFALGTNEGAQMPNAQTPLTNVEAELVRQWIYYGAPLNNNVEDESLITNFYNGQGIPDIAIPAAPPVGQGLQVKLGKIFLSPGEEFEYYLKYKLDLPDTVEVTRVTLIMNEYSHHYILFKFVPGQEGSMPNGLRGVNVANVFPDETEYLLAWSNPGDIELPTGTAYTFLPNTTLDLNYHINNYSQDSILGAEAYINIYYQPKGTAQKEMRSDIIIYPPTSLLIPATNQEYTFTRADFESGSNLTYNLWSLKSHTHKYGTDYDVYVRNADGSKGEKIYEGTYDEDYTVNLGYYNWSHPPTRYFEPLYPIEAKNGLIQEAKFKNCCTSPLVTFGLTTEDEMMLYYMQYTVEETAEPNTVEENEANYFTIMPNPFTNEAALKFYLPKGANVSYEVYDNMGRKVYTQYVGYQTQGINTIILDANAANMAKGVYFIRLQAGDNVISKQVMRID